jgi:hypothetical protein
MIASSKYKCPIIEVTVLLFITCTPVWLQLITAVLELSVIITLPESSFRYRETFYEIIFPLTRGKSNLSRSTVDELPVMKPSEPDY